jgi:hypothetical protein
MNTEQATEPVKATVPVLITPELVKLKINTEIIKHKLTLPDLENRGLTIVKNRDSLPIAKVLLDDLKKVDDLAETIREREKKPFLEGGRACDAGGKLVFSQTERIRGMFKPWYDKELAAVDDETRKQKAKEATDRGILAGIESNVITFSNMVVAATTKKALSLVESRINLEKSPSMAKKYGEHHAKAIERFDSILLPIIKDQKAKVEQMEKLTAEISQAEANNDPDKMDELVARQDELGNEMLQNHANLQEAVLNQESFPVIEATEVLPDFKVKRTNYSMEIADQTVALKKVPELLEISINKEAAKVVLDRLKKDGAFDGKDEVIENGIKYIATRVREAL